MSTGAFNHNLLRGAVPGEPLARRVQELEKRLFTLEQRTKPAGRNVYWNELSGPWSSTAPPTSLVTFDVQAAGLYLAMCQFTAFATGANSLGSKELYVDDTMVNSTAQMVNTANVHHTIALEAGFVDLDIGSHTVGIRWFGGTSFSDTNDRASFYLFRA